MVRFTKRKGHNVQVSYDDGKHWQSTGFKNKEQAEAVYLSGDKRLKDYADRFFERKDENSFNYLEKMRSTSRTEYTSKQKTYYLYRYIIPRFGDYFLTEVKAREITKWLLSLKSFHHNKSLSSTAKNQILTILRQILDMAVLDGIVPQNEARKVKSMNVVTEKKEGLSQRELDILFPEDNSSLYNIYGDDALYFLIFKDTGFRPSEILALRRRDINGHMIYTEWSYNLNSKEMRHRIKTTGKGKSYKIGAISDRTLFALPDTEGFLFDYSKGSQYYNDKFKKITKKLIGRTVTQYTLRHAFMTNLISKYPKELIMESMGHTKWESCYDDRTPEQIADNIRTALNHYQR